MGGVFVNVDNFVRAETERMFAALQGDGRVGQWTHYREPSPLDHQLVIRLNRDTLYSQAVVDISQGADVTLPDSAGRYMSLMVVNQNHYVNRIYHGAGTYHLSVDEFDTPYVFLGVRTLVDPADPADVASVNALQDQLQVIAASNVPFEPATWDEDSLNTTRAAILELARGIDGFSKAFGIRSEVDPIHHLLGSAAGWGGLPKSEAVYLNIDPKLPVGEYTVTVRDVPVDAFWSVSLYNAEGYFVPNARGVNNVNSVTAERNDDGTITLNFGVSDQDKPNYIPIMDGWNFMIRLYQPREEVRNGDWRFPDLEPA
jgi:hypothetical protein